MYTHRTVIMRLFVSLLSIVTLAETHMSLYHPSMFAFNGPVGCTPLQCGSMEAHPIGPGVKTLAGWWFRGAAYLGAAQIPSPSDAALLPAGGSVTFEIACRKNWTSYVPDQTTVPGSLYDACPDAIGSYHLSSFSPVLLDSVLGGCALAIYDGTDWTKATMANMVIFSVQSACVQQKMTSFDIPAKMPPCTGDYCICTWMWQPFVGTGNFYQTPFYCKVTGGNTKYQIGTPKPPVYCGTNTTACVVGAKQAIYVYNTPANVMPIGSVGNLRAGYHPNYGFTIDGAQTDIFEAAVKNTSASSSATGISTSSKSTAFTLSASRSKLGVRLVAVAFFIF